jgi:hypothetical protein
MMYRNIAEVTALSAYALGALIDVSPENEEAEAFLTGIRDAVIGAAEEIDPEDWNREMVEDYSGRASEIADGAPNVYTWRKWQQFIGVAGWQEDISDYELPADVDGYHGALDAGASLALYSMAGRLVSALAEEIAPTDSACTEIGETACGTDDCTCVFTPVNNDGYPAGADGGNMTPAEASKYHAANDRIIFGHID